MPFGRHDVAGHGTLVAGVRVEGGVAVPGVELWVAVGQTGRYTLANELARLLTGGHALHAACVGLWLV